MNCNWKTTDGKYTTHYCVTHSVTVEVRGKKPPKPLEFYCEQAVKLREENQPTKKGPGNYLHDAILRWVGEGPTRKCGCKDRIAKMNRWGPDGCRKHLDEIVEWLMDEAKKRKWGKFATGFPGSKLFIKRMILNTIKQAERTE